MTGQTVATILLTFLSNWIVNPHNRKMDMKIIFNGKEESFFTPDISQRFVLLCYVLGAYTFIVSAFVSVSIVNPKSV